MLDAKFQKLVNTEPPLTLTAGHKKWFYFLVSVTFSLLIIIGVRKWITLVLFGGLFLFGTFCSLWIILFPNSFSLILDQEGFTVKALWKVEHYKWKAVSEFTVHSQRHMFFTVFFDDSRQSKQDNLMRSFNWSSGTNNYLLDTYGLKPDQLAKLMNYWRERALRQNG